MNLVRSNIIKASKNELYLMPNYTVKTVLVFIRIICLYKDGPHTVRNEGYLDSVIKTKNSILVL